MYEVILCATMLDKNYCHTIDFQNKEQQYDYFTTKVLNTRVLCNTKIDSFQDTLTVEKKFTDTSYYDYLVMRDNLTGDLYCYFIDDREQITQTTTRFYLTLDVFQTYLFDFNLTNSFVDRCHVPRWTNEGYPTNNILDEGIECGHTMITLRETIKEIGNNYIICATTPIGILENGQGGGNTTVTTDGLVSNDLIRMIKGYEGFGEYKYYLGDGVTTYGYGVTLENCPEHFVMLGAEPTTEKLATEVLIDLVNTKYAKLVKEQMLNDGVDLKTVPKHVFDAFTDLCYNTGRYNSSLYKKWLVNRYDETIYTDWLDYIVMEGTEFEDGLRARRKAEADIFKYGIYEKRTITIIGGGTVEGDGYLP